MRTIKAAAVLGALVGFVLAQMPSQMPPMMPMVFNPFFGLTPPGKEKEFKIGSWAEYKITNIDKNANFPPQMKISIVGKEKREGKTYYWMEMEIRNSNGDHDIVKYLTNFDKQDTSSLRTISVIFKHNDEQAIEYDMSPSQMSEMMRYSRQGEPDQTEKTPEPEAEIKTETEIIKVPAGSFKCKHYSVETEKGKNEVWFSDDVPVIGAVKMKSPEAEAVLIKYGNEGAKSAITETPQKINPGMMFPPTGPGGSMPPGSNPMQDAIKNYFGR